MQRLKRSSKVDMVPGWYSVTVFGTFRYFHSPGSCNPSRAGGGVTGLGASSDPVLSPPDLELSDVRGPPATVRVPLIILSTFPLPPAPCVQVAPKVLFPV